METFCPPFPIALRWNPAALFPSMRSPIRVVSIMEAAFVTGPAKNLIGFATRARNGGGELPDIELSTITYARGANPPANPFVDAARAEGITVDLLRERGRFDSAIVPQLRQILERRNPHIVQTHNVKSHFLMRWSGLARQYRWLAFHHGYVTTDLKMRLYNQLDRWSLRAPRRMVTVCGAFARDLQRMGVPAEHITVRHNFIQPFPHIDPLRIIEVRQSLPAPPDHPILLAVGRLSHEKGHVDLIHALERLRRLPFHLAIAGEGPERAAIEEACARLGMAERVTLAGLQHDIRPYYAMAQMMILPSHSEGSPNVLLEAMMAQLPIVATRVGGIPEIVTSGETALLVPPRDPAALAGAIEKLLIHPQERERLARAAREKALAEYSPEAYYRSLASVYQMMLEGEPQLQPA
jgi:glycosyltransferase involved in cell wall biosynthesis